MERRASHPSLLRGPCRIKEAKFFIGNVGFVGAEFWLLSVAFLPRPALPAFFVISVWMRPERVTSGNPASGDDLRQSRSVCIQNSTATMLI